MTSLPTRFALASALALGLSGCASVDRAATASIVPDDYRQRHPLTIATGQRALDVFLAGQAGRLDHRQSEDVEYFAKMQVREGQGPIQAFLPAGHNRAKAEALLAPIRKKLADGGYRGALAVSTYAVNDPGLAAPIRLSFPAMEAKLDSRCGEWPSDLASGSSARTFENKPYYNLGCATQNSLAAMVSDPRDLVRPRVEAPADSLMRTRAITSVREGADPSTTWDTPRPVIGELDN